MILRTVSVLLFLLHFSGLLSQSVIQSSRLPWQSAPKREVRAVWLTTIGGLDWPSSYSRNASGVARQKAELCRLLDAYRRAGINTVLLQTRIRATTLFPSAMEPWDGCLSGIPGVSPGYDPLAYAIEQCHLRGMEIQAWVVTIPVGKWDGAGCRALRKRLPGAIRRIDGEGYMNPEDGRTAAYMAAFCEDLARRYDLDGIHLDYIRYPEKWKIRIPGRQARAHITAIVSAIHDKVKAVKPWMKLTCSPIGKYNDLSRYSSHGWNAYTRVAQDAQGWLEAKLMDELYPMMYFRGNQFYPFALNWQEQRYGRVVAPGLGIYFLSPREGNWQLDDVTRQMYLLRTYGLGHAFFRGRFLTDNYRGVYDFVKTFNAAPALVPAQPDAPGQAPASPGRIVVEKQRITWTGSAPYYNVYASASYPVNVDDASCLVSARRTETNLAIRTAGLYFAVTAMDRYGRESAPVYAPDLSQPSGGQDVMPVAEDGMLPLPVAEGFTPEQLYTVETLQGGVLAMLKPSGSGLDVSRLSPGCYVLRSLNSKGVRHRVGFFAIRRRAVHRQLK